MAPPAGITAFRVRITEPELLENYADFLRGVKRGGTPVVGGKRKSKLRGEAAQQAIETQLGRKKAKKNDPRTCDLDIIDFNKLVSKKNFKINLPHKMMHKRNFVLFPLFEIQKNWIHPDKQIDVKTLISLLPDRDIRSIKQI